ncbi:MAG: hypothetical protein RJB38_1902 [Pseudomonadota bacterium]|jgi:hypothetical protein
MKSHLAQGQVTLEIAISSVALLIILTGAGWILKVTWKKAECTRAVFESSRQALSSHSPMLQAASSATIQETPELVVSAQWCGGQLERVGFRKLERIPEWP